MCARAYVRACMSACMSSCMSAHVFTHMLVLCLHVRRHVSLLACLPAHAHACTHVCTRAHKHVYMQAYAYVYTQAIEKAHMHAPHNPCVCLHVCADMHAGLSLFECMHSTKDIPACMSAHTSISKRNVSAGFLWSRACGIRVILKNEITQMPQALLQRNPALTCACLYTITKNVAGTWAPAPDLMQGPWHVD